MSVNCMLRLVKSIGLIVVTSVSAFDCALAQSQDATEPVEARPMLEEIVVTAQKRSEVSQRAPVAIVAVTGDDLVSRGIENAAQLQKLTPSTQFTLLKNSVNVTVRGIGQSVNAPNADTASATNINGAFVPTEMTGAAFFDLERVEVLPGPQGTLYGRNAAGGVINVITRKPDHVFEGDYTVEYGSYDLINVAAGASIPLTETLSVRPAVKFVHRDGYTNGGADDKDTRAGRISVAWTPSSSDRFDLVTTYNAQRGVGPQETNNPAFFPNDPRRLPFDSEALGFLIDFDTWIGSLQYVHNFDNDMDLTYVGGYADTNVRVFGEFGYGPTPENPGTLDVTLGVRNLTQELRLAQSSSDLKWVVGLYNYRTRGEQFFSQVLRLAGLPSPILNVGDFTQHADGYAAFGQITYSLADPFRVTLGARYSHDNKDIEGSSARLPNPDIPFQGDESWNNFDWRVGIEYDAGPDSLLYATVQTGFNQGGFSTTIDAPGSTQAPVFEPVDVLAFTFGSKNRFFNNRVELNAEGFYYKYDNYQVSARNIVTTSNQVFNAQDVRNYGADVSARFLPTRNDELGVKVAYLDAKSEKLVIPVAPFDDFSGLELPYSPEWTALADYRHTFDLRSGSTMEALVSYQWVDDQWGLYTHADGTFIPDNHNIDLSLTFRPLSETWSLTGYVRNLTDEYVLTKTVGPNFTPGPGFGQPLPPRTAGVIFSGKF